MNATGKMNANEKKAWAAVIAEHPEAAQEGFSCGGICRDGKSVLFDRNLPRAGSFEQIIATPRGDGTFAVVRG